MNTILLASVMLLFTPGGERDQLTGEAMTIQDVIETVKRNLTCEWNRETVDTFKSGDPSDQVTGIACTFTATIHVLEKAAELGCNLVITHEPTYYNHLDSRDMLQDDPVYEMKKAFMDKHGIAVFRFHDHWHLTDPDGIYQGMIEKMAWQPYLGKGEKNVFELPEMTVSEIAAQMKLIFPESDPRVVGDPEMVIRKAAFSAGAPSASDHFGLLQRDDIELILIGEGREWEAIEYVRDASLAGFRKAMIILGHVVSEEAGMEYCSKWLGSFINEVPVHFIQAGDPFQVLTD